VLTDCHFNQGRIRGDFETTEIDGDGAVG